MIFFVLILFSVIKTYFKLLNSTFEILNSHLRLLCNNFDGHMIDP